MNETKPNLSLGQFVKQLAGQLQEKEVIPPNATLMFDVELLGIK